LPAEVLKAKQGADENGTKKQNQNQGEIAMEPDTLKHAMLLIRTLVVIHGDCDDFDAWEKIENVLDELKKKEKSENGN
jgi:hypothetical protein